MANFRGLALGEHDSHLFDVIAHRAVSQRGRPRGINSRHAADCSDGGTLGVGTNSPTERSKHSIQDVANQTRLRDDAIRLDADYASEVLTKINHQARPEHGPRNPRPRAPRVDGDLVFRGVANCLDDVVLAHGNDHRERFDLVETAVHRVRGEIERLQQDFAPDQTTKVVVNSCPAFIHDFNLTLSLASRR